MEEDVPDLATPLLTSRTFGGGLLAAAATAAAPPSFAQQGLAKSINVGFSTVVQGIMSSYYNSIPMTLYWPSEWFQCPTFGLAGANGAAEALEAGRIDIAFLTNSALFALIDKYPNTDAVAIYTFTTGFNAMPAVKADSPLRTIKDLAGKRVGVLSLGNSQIQVTKGLMGLAGGDAASVQFIAVGEGVEAAHALQADRIDAVALFDGAYAQIESVGVKLRELEGGTVDMEQIGFISSAVASRRYLEKNRATLVHILKGVAKASVFAATNPEAAVRIHWKTYPESRARGVGEEEAMRRSLMQVEARLRNVRDVEGLIGNSTARQINTHQDLLLRGGVIRKTVEPPRIWDGSLIKDVNDFDRAAISKQAKEWKA
jgi:NitT/TauT family transport system substrate-binding protein